MKVFTNIGNGHVSMRCSDADHLARLLLKLARCMEIAGEPFGGAPFAPTWRRVGMEAADAAEAIGDAAGELWLRQMDPGPGRSILLPQPEAA